MSLNKLNDSIIKQYLSVGCKTLNAENILINNNSLPVYKYYTPNFTAITPSNSTFGNNFSFYSESNFILKLEFRTVMSLLQSVNEVQFQIELPPGYNSSIGNVCFGNIIGAMQSLNTTPFIGYSSNVITDSNKINIRMTNSNSYSGNIIINGFISLLISTKP